MIAAIYQNRLRLMAAGSLMALLAACGEPLDLDMRGAFGNPFDTTSAAQTATLERPEPDARGVLSYPNYQVAVARRGDTVADVAARAGVDVEELARFNGVRPTDPLREGEVLALQGSAGSGTTATSPSADGGQISITELAGAAIDRAPEDQTPVATAPAPSGPEPIRHRVSRGETAFTISRLYGISVRALADWNGLGADFEIREGQYLLIPVTEGATRTAALEPSVQPGQGSPTPLPPSASQPLPEEVTTPTAEPAATPPKEDLQAERTAASTTGALMDLPVSGSIVRDFEEGKSPGITLSADAGTPVTAAANGTVKLISTTADDREIVIVEHDRNVLSVYANVGAIQVAKGDSVNKGQQIGAVRSGQNAFLQFEVFEGTQRVDPNRYLQ